MNGDYIKLSRNILEWEWYSDVNTCRLFIHMILRANWKEGNFRGNVIPRGSFVSSIGKLADETLLTQDEVRTAVKHLIRTKEITKQSTNKYTVFTVNNYELYQCVPKQDTKQLPTNSQPIPNLFPTIEEKKERKKGINKKETPKGVKKVERYFDDDSLNNAFLDFIKMRKEIKKPMTGRAVEMAIKKLTELATLPFGEEMDAELAVKILEQSIFNNWQGLFPLKENGGGNTGGSRECDTTYDAKDIYGEEWYEGGTFAGF